MNKILVLIVVLFAVACSNSSPAAEQTEKSVEEIKSEGAFSNSDIIRNPVSANEPIDTNNVAKITFEEPSFDFGEVDEGEIVEHIYTFTNTGEAPLIIRSARSTCGCTVPEWPKEPIAPGQSGKIAVKFNTAGKKNQQAKPVTVVANTYPTTTKVLLKGFVRSQAEEPAQ